MTEPAPPVRPRVAYAHISTRTRLIRAQTAIVTRSHPQLTFKPAADADVAVDGTTSGVSAFESSSKAGAAPRRCAGDSSSASSMTCVAGSSGAAQGDAQRLSLPPSDWPPCSSVCDGTCTRVSERNEIMAETDYFQAPRVPDACIATYTQVYEL